MSNSSASNPAFLVEAAKPEVREIAYFQGPYECFPTRILAVGTRLIAEFAWERGWCRANASQAVGIFKRFTARAVMQPGDAVIGWTADGWQWGRFISRAGDSFVFDSLSGQRYEAANVEPHSFRRGDRVLAQIDGEWQTCAYEQFQNGRHLVRTEPSWKTALVTELKFTAEASKPGF